jgi:hypothetical protein
VKLFLRGPLNWATGAKCRSPRSAKSAIKKYAIYYKAGDCIMPREGVFGRVLKEGRIQVGDVIELVGPEAR